MSSHARGLAKVFLLKTEEGGRRTPFGAGYTPQLFFGATDVPGSLHFEEAVVAKPEDQLRVQFTLARPIALEPGMRFAMREAGRTVGAGVVTAVE